MITSHDSLTARRLLLPVGRLDRPAVATERTLSLAVCADDIATPANNVTFDGARNSSVVAATR